MAETILPLANSDAEMRPRPADASDIDHIEPLKHERCPACNGLLFSNGESVWCDACDFHGRQQGAGITWDEITAGVRGDDLAKNFRVSLFLRLADKYPAMRMDEVQVVYRAHRASIAYAISGGPWSEFLRYQIDAMRKTKELPPGPAMAVVIAESLSKMAIPD